jgi:3-oxoacyl-[acyl-carrier protein] reductase
MTSSDPFNFAGRTVLVTGAAHGFGRAIAVAFAARGARVRVCDLLGDEIAQTRALCLQAGGICTPEDAAVVDVTDRDSALAFAQSTPADVLVNNAGGVLGQVGQPLEHVTAAQWHAIFDVNVTAAFTFAQAVAPHMKARRTGRIVNISSGAGLSISMTGIQAYASAKAAQIGLTRQLAHELGPFGITVNNIAPGFVRSNPNSERQWQSYGAAGQQEILDSIALRRLGTPEDIAHAVLFFASDFAAWVTGQVLAVDGGK